MCQASIDICIDRECRKEPQLRFFSTWVAIAFCSSIGGIGTMSDLALSDFSFFTVDPTARELNALYIVDYSAASAYIGRSSDHPSRALAHLM